MSKITELVSYLKGKADGMELNLEKPANKLLMEVLEVMGKMAEEMENIADTVAELDECMDEMSDDLSDLESAVYDDGDEDAYADAADEMDEENVIIYQCPHCGAQNHIDPADVDFDDETPCQFCGKELFPELQEEDEAVLAGNESEE